MRGRKLISTLLVVVLAVSLVLTGCAGSKTNTQPNAGDNNSQKAPKVTINLGTEPPQMNTILSTDNTSHNVQRHVFEGLTRLGKDGKPMPGIAEKWTTSADGLTWTFTLRDSKWSDGTPVTAKDFEFAYKEALKKETAAEYAYLFYMFKNGEAYNKGTAKAEDVGVKAINDKTLELKLEAPAPFILDLLAFGNFSPVKQDFYSKQEGGKKYGADADKMVYNGPWMVKEWKHEDRMVLVKNPNYWNAKEIKLDEITMLMVKDSNTGLNMFLGNELDMVGITGAQVDKAKTEGYTPVGYPDGATFYFEYNVKDPVTKNANIRKALTYAVDRKTFVGGVLKDPSQPALNLTNPVIYGEKESFSKEIGALLKDNNQDEAKKLFADGLKELGLTAAPKISILTDDTDVAKRNAAAFQEMWKKNLGIEVEVTILTFQARLERMKNKDFQIVIAGWSADYNDPISFLDMFETGNGNNHSQYSSKDYDELLGKIRKEPDAKKRMDMLKQLEKLLLTDMPIGPIYHRYRYYLAKPSLKGLVRQWGQDIDMYWSYVDSSAK